MAENHMGLSPRERQIAELLLQGCDNGEIAQLLKMKRRTVKAHLNRLFHRFEIKDGIKRVKLATLLYRRLSTGRSSGTTGFPAIEKIECSNSSLAADLSLSAPALPKSQPPPMELPTNRSTNAELNIRRTA